VSSWGRLPDEITLTRAEAATVLFALDEAAELLDPSTPASTALGEAADILVNKFLPDLPDL
jgi:hypothetical protein